MQSSDMHIGLETKPIYCRRFLFILTVYLALTCKSADDHCNRYGESDTCVCTHLIPKPVWANGDGFCTPLCQTFNETCRDSGNAAFWQLLHIQNNIYDCGKGKVTSGWIDADLNSCSYVFLVSSPRGETCPEVCDATRDLCLCDEYISELWNMIGETEKENKNLQGIIQYHKAQLSDIDREKLNLQSSIDHWKSIVEYRQNVSYGYYEDLTDLNTSFKDVINDIKDLNDSIAGLNILEERFEFIVAEQNRTIVKLGEKHDMCRRTLKQVNSRQESMLRFIEESATNCQDIRVNGRRVHGSDVYSGIFTINPNNDEAPFEVFCDMSTDGGGWTIIQRRQDGSVDFYRGWEDYKNGFGDLNGEFWLGNDKIHRLTNQGQRYELRADLENFENETRFAKYDDFAIGNEDIQYSMFLGSYTGDAGNSLRNDNGLAFSTKDRDNDISSGNCAETNRSGAWWFSDCGFSNLNGQYLHGYHQQLGKGVFWYDFQGWNYSLKHTEIKIRPVF
ncbi:uncharacterized protein [Ptychodera flava]|uniref:uncharacterized protein n=1 Tax=Ptychodera flava TaxID=63121 RepID=UPI00396A697D